MRAARVPAQAKVNLTLHVLGRDLLTGYHDIHTIFQRIDLADDVVVRIGGSTRSIDLSGPQLPPGGLGPPEKNLAYRAAVEYAKRKSWPSGFAIELTKNIPVGGGLGGGSADAGSVLRALNTLSPDPMTDEELAEAAKKLGADVPFLTRDWTRALGTGRGTHLTNASDASLPAVAMLVVAPRFAIATADAYRWLDEDREHLGLTPGEVGPDRLPASSWEDLGRHPRMRNDFEPSVEARHSELRDIRERLMEKGAAMARLAGSGSCVWGIFSDTPPAASELGLDALVMPSRISSRVVQVEVLE